MDYWPVLGLLGILALWGAVALVPWYVLLIARRGRGTFVALPLAVVAGIAGGALVPAFGGKTRSGSASACWRRWPRVRRLRFWRRSFISASYGTARLVCRPS